MSDTATAAGSAEKPASDRASGLPRVIAVDGSAASGKTSVGRRLAARLGYPFLDTGVMYRAITLAAVRAGVSATNTEGLARLARRVEIGVDIPAPASDGEAVISLDGQDVTADLRIPEVEDLVSLVSRVPAVRKALVDQQRRIAADREIVMAGRDIGTVVLPGADLKLYLDAPLEERARRRQRDFEALGRTVSREDVLEDIRRRDRIDSERSVSPLRPAADATLIDTEGLTLDEVMAKVFAIVLDRTDDR
jgi:cytidylate kinase